MVWWEHCKCQLLAWLGMKQVRLTTQLHIVSQSTLKDYWENTRKSKRSWIQILDWTTNQGLKIILSSDYYVIWH